VFNRELHPQFCCGQSPFLAVGGGCSRSVWRPRAPEAVERDMSEFQASKSGSSLSSIECPRCPRCQARMTLESISPAPTGYDLRTFDCAKCDRTLTRLVPRDPMKTGDALRWLDGELGSFGKLRKG
jgi:hypothetical protein